MKRFNYLSLLVVFALSANAQPITKNGKYGDGPDSNTPVGIIKGLTVYENS